MHPIQAFLHDIVETGQVTGAAALVRQGGKEIFFGSAGLRDLTAGAPFSRDTVMRMFSMSKIVTAAAVLKLCEQNILAPETPVAAILPEYAHMNVLMPDVFHRTVWKDGERAILKGSSFACACFTGMYSLYWQRSGTAERPDLNQISTLFSNRISCIRPLPVSKPPLTI